MGSIFSKIVKGEINAYKVAEDENFLAFLDISPLAEGHTLVIPKKEISYIFDLDDKSYADMFLFAKKVARAIKEVIPCTKVGVAIIGLEVAHAHIHLVPINHVYDIDFKKEKLNLTPERFREIADLIASHVK
ncbi:MAG: HIT family protein [Candidatus Paceibacterota bacterium]